MCRHTYLYVDQQLAPIARIQTRATAAQAAIDVALEQAAQHLEQARLSYPVPVGPPPAGMRPRQKQRRVPGWNAAGAKIARENAPAPGPPRVPNIDISVELRAQRYAQDALRERQYLLEARQLDPRRELPMTLLAIAVFAAWLVLAALYTLIYH